MMNGCAARTILGVAFLVVGAVAANAAGGSSIAAQTEFTNSIGMKFVRIDPGTFVMGTAEDPVLPEALTTDIVGEKKGPMAHRLHGDFDEHPAHEVVLTEPFHMAATEVTNAQFEAFDFTHGRRRGEQGFSCMDDEAVVFVSWHDAVAFCDWLSEKEGLPYRLPTEAEWEYACRAGTRTAFSTGQDLPEAFHKNVFESWHPDPDPSRITEKFRKPERRYTDNIVPLTVAQTPPNPWGLFDMHGNVEEWCLDWYGPYAPGRQTNPGGHAEADFRVARGGSHSTELYFLRSANRMGTLPEDRSWLIGFRVVIGKLPATAPLPRPAPPAHQQRVSQDIPKMARTGDGPFFEGPRQYVKIDENAHGPLFIDHNHDPGIAPCPNGDLLAIWYTTSREKGRELCLAASRLRYGTEAWEPASLFWLAPDRNLHAPSIWTDKESGILYQFVGLSAAATWGNLAAVMRTSSDSGATWSRARLIAPEHGLRHQMSEPVIRTRDGALMVANDANSVGGTSLLISRDNGETWSDSGGAIRGIHGGVVELRDGGLFGLGRGNDMDGRMPASHSTDRGKTWTYAPSPFQPVGGGQRLVLLRLQEGPIMLISFAKDVEMTAGDGARRVCSGMFAALSFDETETWPVMRLVTPGGPPRDVGSTNNRPFTMSDVSAEPRGYLSGCQGYDGVIHIISSFQHYAFNLTWVTNGFEPANAVAKQ
jgi:formylglycine-generating enzyme required for sulfatase activity